MNIIRGIFIFLVVQETPIGSPHRSFDVKSWGPSFFQVWEVRKEMIELFSQKTLDPQEM
jgi:hypothetical protein